MTDRNSNTKGKKMGKVPWRKKNVRETKITKNDLRTF